MAGEEVALFVYDTDSYVQKETLPDGWQGLSSVIRLWGRTPGGDAVLVHVDGYDARFFVGPSPGGLPADEVFAVLDATIEKCAGASRRQGAAPWARAGPATRVFPFEGYRDESLAVRPVSVPWIRLSGFLKRFLDAANGRAGGRRGVAPPLVLGLNRNKVIAFHADTKTFPGAWVRVRNAKRVGLGDGGRHARPYVLEFRASAEDVADADAEMRGTVPPLRFACWDIEAVAESGANRFPDASRPHDRVVQISVVRGVLGAKEPTDSAVGTLDSCDPVPGCEIHAFPCDQKDEWSVDRAERELIRWFIKRIADVDIMMTWNGACFDLPFLFKRSERLLEAQEEIVGPRGTSFPRLPALRLLGKDARPIEDPSDAKEMRGRLFGPEDRRQSGRADDGGGGKGRVRSDYSQRVTAGLVHFDLLQEVRSDTGLRGFVPSLKLGVVAAHILGETKDDLDISMLPLLFREGGAEGRARIATYCLQDSVLLHRMAVRRDSLNKSFALCKATGVPLSSLQFGGSTIRGVSLIARVGRGMPVPIVLSKNVAELVPKDPSAAPGGGGPGPEPEPEPELEPEPEPGDGGDDESGDESGSEDGGGEGDREGAAAAGSGPGGGPAEPEKYKGAFVISPMIGRYDAFTMVMDYNSLYPNVMRSCSLCRSLYVGCVRGLSPAGDGSGARCAIVGRRVCKEEDHVFAEVSPGKIHVFRRATKERPGIVPFIVADLIRRRKETRALMTDPRYKEDPNMLSVLDALQLALKIIANSLYGIFGARFGAVAFRPVAESTTAFGREAIRTAMRCALSVRPDARVVYGDTDSIFVYFPEPDPYGAFGVADRIAEEINRTNKEVKGLQFLNIEVEKGFAPFILAGKKTYAGMKYVRNDAGKIKDPSPSMSGFQAVKRSALPATATLQREMIKALLSSSSGELEGASEQERLEGVARSAMEHVLYRAWCLLEGNFALSDIQLRQKNQGAWFETEGEGEGSRRVMRLGPYKETSTSLPVLQLMAKMDARVEGSAPAPGCYVHYVVVRAREDGVKESIGQREEVPIHLQGGGEGARPVDRTFYANRLLSDSCAVLRAVLVELGDPFHDARMILSDRKGVYMRAVEKARADSEASIEKTKRAFERKIELAERDAEKRSRPRKVSRALVPVLRSFFPAATSSPSAASSPSPSGAGNGDPPATPDPEVARLRRELAENLDRMRDERDAAVEAAIRARERFVANRDAEVTQARLGGARKKRAAAFSARVHAYLGGGAGDLTVTLRGDCGRGGWVRGEDEGVTTRDAAEDAGTPIVVFRADEREALFERFRRRLEAETLGKLRDAWAADVRSIGRPVPPQGPIPLSADDRTRIFVALHAEGDNPNYFRRAAYEAILRNLLRGEAADRERHPSPWDDGAFLETIGVLAPEAAPAAAAP